MDGNKDEALKCIRIAEEAIAKGNKARALKFIKIAQRLNSDLSLDHLLTKCNTLHSQSSSTPSQAENGALNRENVSRTSNNNNSGGGGGGGGLNGERNYTQEHVKLVREIKGKNDYYAILGLEKNCSVEEIRKAYRKLSLKVHPDKNKAPGSEEAFKKMSKAFKCLSDDGTRRQYDQIGLEEEYEYNQQHNFRRRRGRASMSDFFDDDIDPDEVFRTFFGESHVFGRGHDMRTRGMGGGHQRQEFQGHGTLNFMMFLQVVPFLIVFLIAYLPFSEPDYSLHKNYSYQIPKTIEKNGVEFFVKSESFEARYPPGSPARAKIESSVMHDHRNLLRRYCQIELQRRSWNRNLPTPYCEKLQKLEVA